LCCKNSFEKYEIEESRNGFSFEKFFRHLLCTLRLVLYFTKELKIKDRIHLREKFPEIAVKGLPTAAFSFRFLFWD